MKKMKLDIQLFNGSVAIQTITETTDDSLDQSTFTIPAKMTTTGATYNNSNASMTLQWKYESASSWTSLSKQTFKIGKNSSVTKSWTLTLDHNPDGTLENVQFRVSWYITDSTKGTTGATTFTPTTIPRASIPTLSSSNVNMGSSVTIYTNRYSSSFTHTIRYVFGNANGTIASNVATSIIWTPSLTLANQIPSSTSGVGTIYCDTYNGSTLIGTKTINITLNVPSSIVPSISFTQVQEAGSVPSGWGIYVKSKSKVALAISGNGSYGSSISGYRISYYGGAVTTSSATTSFLTQSGTTTFTGQVTDTRGRSASTTTTINVVDYSNPTISTAQVQRCDANGNIDNNGEYMYISYGASISSCSNKNTPSAVYKVGYRVHNTGSYTYVQLGTNANSYSASGMLFSDGIKAVSASGTKVQFSTNNTYDIQFYVKDYFTEYTNVQSLDAGFDLLNFNASGKAMAIGKVSEAGANEAKLEVAMDLYNNALDLFNDTSGSDWKTMLSNKIDYCIANMDTNKYNAEMFINGGWQGVNYGFGIFSKIGEFYQLVWYSNFGTYYCRRTGNTYDYEVLGGNNYRCDIELVVGRWINGKPIYRQTFGYDNVPINTETTFYWNNSMYGNSLTNPEEIINYKAFYRRSDGTFQQVPNVHSYMPSWGAGIYDLSSTFFRFWVGDLANAFAINYLIITIEYTKTTD